MNILTNLEFSVVEALRSIRRSGLMSLVAIGIVTISLTVFGIFLLFAINLGNMVSFMGTRLDIVAYVDRDLNQDSAQILETAISQIPGVDKVNYIPKDQAWKTFREEFGAKLDIADVVKENPLPNAFAVRVRTPDILPRVAEQVARFSDVSEVRYSGKLIKQIQNLVDAVRIGGAVLSILLFFATLLIVVNTIRLTVLARETDIYIMRLVGATNSFIRWPFVIEGILMGILGGILGVIILRFSYDAVLLRVKSALPFLPVVADSGLLTFVYVCIGISGVMLGMLGGYISVSRILKEKG
ncbi:MAG: cell division transport system permease protein [Candidatus Saganbacteria bacterium]|uniref:Cell division protein FtsX n=1 Tax=Candidatus Saganbacteria bacterium TaxID=2575572 RepID=A0A833L176_UNCSA|nr:MAG: cell division transport system permease protein [Candidatus Saganbacteria bacterium]